MKSAIQDYKIEGVTTTLPFGKFVMEHDAFVSGNFDTHFVRDFFTKTIIMEKQKVNAEVAALVALRFWQEKQKQLRPVEHKSTSWKRRLS